MTGVGFLLGGVITALTSPPTAFAVSGLGVVLVVGSWPSPGAACRRPRTRRASRDRRPRSRSAPGAASRPRAAAPPAQTSTTTGSTIGRRLRRS